MSIIEVLLVLNPYGTIENIIYAIATVLSIILLAVSISAYRNTGVKRIKYAIVAFALFAVYLFHEFMEDAFEQVHSPFTDLTLSSLTFGVAVFFFLAIVRKNRSSKKISHKFPKEDPLI